MVACKIYGNEREGSVGEKKQRPQTTTNTAPRFERGRTSTWFSVLVIRKR